MAQEALLATLGWQIKGIFVKFTCWIDVKAICACLLVISDYLTGIDNRNNMKILITLIVIDMITAIISEMKLGHKIESRKALKTATKIVVYGLMVSGAHLTENAIPGTTFIDNAAISFLAVTELISILENIGKAGYAIPKKLLCKLHNIRKKQ